MRSEPGRPGRPQTAGFSPAPGAGGGRPRQAGGRALHLPPRGGGAGGLGAPSHQQEVLRRGPGAARAPPPQGAPPPRRLAVRPGREAAGAGARARRARLNGGAGARGTRGRRLGRPGRAVPELHVRGAGLRERLPVGRVVPQEPGKGRPPPPPGGGKGGAALLPTLRDTGCPSGKS